MSFFSISLRLNSTTMLSSGSGAGGIIPPANRIGWGLNLTSSDYYMRQRNYMNLALYSRWLRSDQAVMYSPNVVDGELIEMESGFGVRKLIGYPRVSSRIRATFTPGSTGSFTGTGVSNPTSGPGWCEADIAVPADRNSGTLAINFTYVAGTNPLGNLDIREVGAVADRFDPEWIDEISRYKAVRFLDLSGILKCWMGDADNETKWSDVPNNPQSAQASNSGLSGVTLGTGNGTIRFADNGYVKTPSVLATYLPDHWYGERANTLSVTILAASGSGSISVVGKNVIITPAAGVDSANAIKTQVEANTIADAMFNVTIPSGTGADAVGTVAQTYLSGSRKSPTTGMPPADIVAICNAAQVSPWVCLPFRATVEYAVNYIQHLIDNLDPACLPIYIEHGNEPWNSGPGFLSNGLNAAWAIKLGLADAAAYHSSRHVEIMSAIRAAVDTAKIRTVYNVQSAVPGTINTVAAHPNVLENTDHFCTAPYFAYNSAPANVDAAIDGGLLSIDTVITSHVTVAKANAEAHGKSLIFYEGGQHYYGIGQTLMEDTMRSPRMKEAYNYYLSEIRRVAPDSLFLHYAETGPIENAGAWGMQEYTEQPRENAPRYDAYLNALDGNFTPYFRIATPPTITGTRYTGYTLTANGTPYRADTVSYQWTRDGVDISGANASTYVQQVADEGAVVNVKITLTNAFDSRLYTTTDGAATIEEPAPQAETTALIARMTSPPDALRQSKIDALIVALKTGAISNSNIWAKIEHLYLLYAHDAQAARLNWKGAAGDLTVTGTMNFTTDSGYVSGGATTDYLTTGINFSAMSIFSQDSAHLGAWCGLSNVAAPAISKTTSGGGSDFLLPANTSGTPNVVARANATSGFNITSTAGEAFWLVNRSGSAAAQLYRNETAISSNTQTSSSREALPCVIGKGATFPVRAVTIGGSLTANEEADLYNALADYLA